MSEFVRGAVRRIAILTAFICCSIMAFALMREAIVGHRLAHDYGVYWRTANEPVEMAYSHKDFQPFPYAPTMLFWLMPLSIVSKFAGYVTLGLLSIVALFFACRRYLTKAAFALTLLSAPTVRCLRNGQISAILAALLIWSFGTKKRNLAGVGLGVIASIKPQLVIMAPLMLVFNRDWRAFHAAAATFAALILISLLFGTQRWAEWYESLGPFRDYLVREEVVGITPAALADYYGLNPIPFMTAGIVAGTWLVFMCRDMEPLERATAVGAGSLLAAPYALAYDLLVIVPFVALMVMKGRLWGFIAIAALANPAPLILAAFELLSSKNIMFRKSFSKFVA